MGFNLVWLATRGLERDQVLEICELQPTGERESQSDADITAVQLASGWYVIVLYNVFGEELDAITTPLVARCEVVACCVGEGPMASSSEAWKDGHQIWEVTHALDNGDQDLEIEGEPPPILAAIVQDTLARDDGEADYFFDIPVDLAEHITGFRHDKDPIPETPSAEPFEVLTFRL